MKLNLQSIKEASQRGFTMIELIIVIAILGILAALAVPRFANFSSSATTAAKSSIVGSINSAISIAHAQWIANGSIGTVTLEGGTAITMNPAGYPDVGTTYNDATTCGTLVSALLSNQNGLTAGYTTNCTVTGSFGTVNITPTSAN